MKKSKQQHQNEQDGTLVGPAHKFYMVAPFLTPLKKWISEQRKSTVLMPEAPKDISAELGMQMLSSSQCSEENSRFQGSVEAPKVSPAAFQENSTRGFPKGSSEEASARLKRLLSVQASPTPAPIMSANNGRAPQSNQEKSNALLALLRKGAQNTNSYLHQDAESQTDPSAQSHAVPPRSEPPPSDHPLPVPFANLLSSAVSSRSAKPPIHTLHVNTHPQQHHTPGVPPFRVSQNLSPPQQLHQNSSANQLRPFQAPHVAGSLAHGPIIQTLPDSRTQRSHTTEQRSSIPSFTQVAQFTNVHAPVVPAASQLPPPKLTSHSLALLNVLTNGQRSNPAEQHIAVTKPDESKKERNRGVQYDLRPSSDSLELDRGKTIPRSRELSKPIPAAVPQHLSFDRRGSQSADHKQALLSLFSKPSPLATPVPGQSRSTSAHLDEKLSAVRADILSQVRSKHGPNVPDSLPGFVDSAAISRSQTSRRSADREFLLGYLQGVAKGGN